MKHTKASEESMLRFLFRLSWSTIVGIFFVIPSFAVLYVLNDILRAIVNVRLWLKYGPWTHVLEQGADSIWLYKVPNGKRSILYLAINDEPVDMEKHRQNYLKKLLNRPTYYKLLQIFTTDFQFNIQKLDRNFDIKNHVNIFDGLGDRVITEEELMDEILPQLSEEMDDSKPQWEDVIIPKFKYSAKDEKIRSARVFRVGHGYMDGGSNLLMIADSQYEGKDPFPFVVDPKAQPKIALWKRALYKFNCLLMFGWVVIHGLMYPASEVIQNRFTTPKLSGKTFYGWSKPIPMETLKKIKNSTGESMPTILMSVLGGAIQKLNEKFPYVKKNEGHLSECNKSPQDNEIEIGMVAGIFPYPDNKLRNKHSIFHVKVDVSKKAALDRLKASSETMEKVMWDPHVYLNSFIPSLFGRTPIWFTNACMKVLAMPLVLSNIPVAQRRVKLWENNVLDIGGWPPMLSNCGVGTVTIRYGDTLRVCVNSDQNTMSKEELHFLKAQIVEEVQILAEAVAGTNEVATTTVISSQEVVEEEVVPTPTERKSTFFQRNLERNFFHQHSNGNKNSLKFRLNASINTIKDSLSKFREP